METIKNQPLHTCSYCKRELPQEAFYVNKRNQTLDCHCKECRKKNSRKHRKTNKGRICIEDNKPSYPVITQVNDSAIRSALIRHALETVAESIQRKKNKIKLHELWEE